MGTITVILDGSFGRRRERQFSAMQHGHAAAVGEALRYLAETELPEAIRNDHRAARDRSEPAEGFAGMGRIYDEQGG